jgi:hypothetical protein
MDVTQKICAMMSYDYVLIMIDIVLDLVVRKLGRTYLVCDHLRRTRIFTLTCYSFLHIPSWSTFVKRWGNSWSNPIQWPELFVELKLFTTWSQTLHFQLRGFDEGLAWISMVITYVIYCMDWSLQWTWDFGNYNAHNWTNLLSWIANSTKLLM